MDARPERPIDIGSSVAKISNHPPKFRLAINYFVLAYSPKSHLRLDYAPKRKTDFLYIAFCDDVWRCRGGQVCPSIGRALEIAARFWATGDQDWVLVQEDIEPWRATNASSFRGEAPSDLETIGRSHF